MLSCPRLYNRFLTSFREWTLVTKRYHEIRDPIHGFVKLDSDERHVLDSPPVQRLRNIHQLAMSYLVYPGATHKRFEHSLGVMELAGRVFDAVTDRDRIHGSVTNMFRSIPGDIDYWRRVVRIAALCHDIGHLPFSHAAEMQLLPDGKTHESITAELIDTMRILPDGENFDEPTLGIEAGGIHSSEALLLARSFMFMQMYHHPVRTAYDLHLEEFLKAWLPGEQVPSR